MNHAALKTVRQSARTQFFHDADRMAASLSYFFSERIADVQDLAESRELSIFFENRALGMSMAYGLQASLVAITNKLLRTVERKQFNDKQIYQRIMFIGHDAHILSDTHGSKINPSSDLNLGTYLQPDIQNPKILSTRK